MKDLLRKFEQKQPEIVFEWSDNETDAKGWVVINSLRGGAAGGGTRMRVGLDKREVESLAKTMEVKFTVAGPAIGGAKSGINFDPKDPRKHEVLRRWYKAVAPLLKNYYGTGGDMNVDEVHEVIPMCEEVGVLHPQEGVFNGHFSPSEEIKKKRIKQLQEGVLLPVTNPALSPDVNRKYNIADMITGFGVSESVRLYLEKWGDNVKDKKVIVQGWGNVASAGAFYLAQNGAKIVGIIDRVGGIIKEEGFTFEEIKNLFLTKNGNELNATNMLTFEEVNEKIWDVPTDIFIPCAASRIVTKEQAERMISKGLTVIASGANVPFADQEIFFGPITEYVDANIALIPDFISNCGMARVFAYLMSTDLDKIEDNAIFNDVTATIDRALDNIHKNNTKSTGIANSAFEIALEQLV